MTWAPGPLLRVLACLGLAALVYAWAPPPDGTRTGLALFALIGSLWMTQALHLSVTALLVPLLAVLTGLMDVRPALAAFAHPIIFVFLGGFALAAALHQQGLDHRLAAAVLKLAAGRRTTAVALLFGLSALLSMWISNTATAAMMLPLALGLLHDDDGPAERAFVLLGVAYSASIGGIGTLVGSPPNAIAAAQAGIGFAQWMAFGVPMVLALLPLMAGTLYLVLRPRLGGRTHVVPPSPRTEPLNQGQRLTLAVFACTAAGWVGSAPLGRLLGISADLDSVVAIAAIVALMKAQFDRPEAPLKVHPVATEGDWALAGWQQGDRGGRALLRRAHGMWQIVLCGGAGLLNASTLEQAGLSKGTARRLRDQTRRLEAALPASDRARMDAFEGLIQMHDGTHGPGHGNGHAQ